MARRKRRRSPAAVRGLTWRGGIAYWQRVHAKLPNGRVNKSLRTSDPDVAVSRATAVNTLMDRGDWAVLRRWVADELDITDLVGAVREGEYSKLRRVYREGLILGHMTEQYLARVSATRSRRTHQVYESAVNQALAHFGRDARMHEVTTAAAEEYLHAAKKEAGGKIWSANSQAHHRTILGALWDFARDRETEDAEQAGAHVTLTANPWRKALTATRWKTRFSFLTPKEARELLAHSFVVGTPMHALLSAAIYRGLRASELAHLRTDVDVVLTDKPETSSIHVQSREGAYPWRPKTRRSERSLPMIPALWEVMVYHRQHYAGPRYFFHGEREDRPPTLKTLGVWTERVFSAVGIRYGREGDALTLHSLRHTFATWLVSGAIPIPTVARMMGDTEAIVLSTYAHHMPDQDIRANALLEEHARGKGDEPPENGGQK